MPDLHFKTRELTFLEKLLQAYWMNPKSWLLEEFILKNGKLTITRKDGNQFSADLNETSAFYLVDKFDRREITIECSDGAKTRFKEIPWMLEDEDWNKIVEVLDAEELAMSEALRGVNDIIEDVKKHKET
ncbi:MAG: hypothetical protein ACPGVB_10870 [Chitinophagales bacterium]